MCSYSSNIYMLLAIKKIVLMNKILLLIFCLLLVSSCFEKSDKEKIALAQLECSKKTRIDELYIKFFGYFPKEAHLINIKIKRGKYIIENFNDIIPDTVVDSLRHQRDYCLKKEILLSDTVIFKIKNEPEKKAYDFKYRVRAHYNMFSSGFGCDYYEVTVNGEKIEGGGIDFMKKGFDILKIKKEDFKEYYKH